ncbi:Rab family GTPase [Entamoeba marina]
MASKEIPEWKKKLMEKKKLESQQSSSAAPTPSQPTSTSPSTSTPSQTRKPMKKPLPKRSTQPSTRLTSVPETESQAASSSSSSKAQSELLPRKNSAKPPTRKSVNYSVSPSDQKILNENWKKQIDEVKLTQTSGLKTGRPSARTTLTKEANINIIVLGESAVGKTSLISRYVKDHFDATFLATTGIDFVAKTVKISTTNAKLKIWDTAGQERFRTIVPNYYRNVYGVVVVFDVSSRKSFENVTYWMKDVREKGMDNLSVALVGNKTDLDRLVTQEEAQQLAEQTEAKYYESSAKTGDGVNNIFLEIATSVLDKHPELTSKKTSVKVQRSNQKKKEAESGGCC